MRIKRARSQASPHRLFPVRRAPRTHQVNEYPKFPAIEHSTYKWRPTCYETKGVEMTIRHQRSSHPEIAPRALREVSSRAPIGSITTRRAGPFSASAIASAAVMLRDVLTCIAATPRRTRR